VSAAPPPNTVIELPGIGFVILNEQFCDANGTLANQCSDGTALGRAGLTVRNIHVVVTVPDNPSGLTPGAEIIVAEAHSTRGSWSKSPPLEVGGRARRKSRRPGAPCRCARVALRRPGALRH
jgi:hypothetical protein